MIPAGGSTGTSGAAAVYEIRVAGLVPDDALEDLGAMSVEPAPVSTVLLRPIIDQSDLLGVLARLRTLGLEVIEVRRVRRRPEPGPQER
ncbi:hypothetical protein [Georgenia sp. SYP-B2076]|uniref:hypothetical protein n=1 Tax=Georgenia sp. SYP-B2076 TaxID=2495881 RepID=UPI000F8D66A8|nr:hypothetical protein [Georgenia sp. SYP-B2076]